MSEAKHSGVVREFTGASFLWRLAASLILVLATYNPAGFSYYHWLPLSHTGSSPLPTHALQAFCFGLLQSVLRLFFLAKSNL